MLYTVEPGQIATVRVRINRTRLPILRGTGMVSVRAAATITDGRPARATLLVRRHP